MPTSDLDAAFAAIDRRFRACSPAARRMLRATVAYNHGDLDAWAREMEAGVAEFADAAGIPRAVVARYLLPVDEQLRRRPRPTN